jgi:molecular chaperone GrpE
LRAFGAVQRGMSSGTENSGRAEDKGSAEAGKSSANASASNGNAAASPAGPTAAELAAVKAEADELKKQLQYAYADRENIRRILMRDVKDAKEYGMREFAKDLLDVSDNFERALEAAKADAARLPEVKSLYDGVFMTEQQLHKVFDRYGIKRMSPIGAKFDPQTHAALLEMHHDEHPEGHVAVVIKSG